jgi:hypothetical protein
MECLLHKTRVYYFDLDDFTFLVFYFQIEHILTNEPITKISYLISFIRSEIE